MALAVIGWSVAARPDAPSPDPSGMLEAAVPASPTSEPTALPASSPAAARAAPTATPVPTRTPAPTPSSRSQAVEFVQDEGLQAAVDGAVGELANHVGIYVKRLNDGAGASVNAERVFGTASLFKAFVMWEAFQQREAGRLDFAQTMLVTPYYKSWELGTGVVQAGDVVTVGFALRMMMSVSDTPTAVLLQDTLGVDSINASLRALGITDSGLFYPGDPIATAHDFGVLLEAVYRGTGVSEASRDEMIALMLSEQIDYGLRSGVPEGVPVAHKTGSLLGLLHDAGIVFSEGGDYVIVVLTDAIAGGKIAEVSGAVYEYFNPGAKAKATLTAP